MSRSLHIFSTLHFSNARISFTDDVTLPFVLRQLCIDRLLTLCRRRWSLPCFQIRRISVPWLSRASISFLRSFHTHNKTPRSPHTYLILHGQNIPNVETRPTTNGGPQRIGAFPTASRPAPVPDSHKTTSLLHVGPARLVICPPDSDSVTLYPIYNADSMLPGEDLELLSIHRRHLHRPHHHHHPKNLQ